MNLSMICLLANTYPDESLQKDPEPAAQLIEIISKYFTS
jgi:hypothetical protein